MVVNIKPEQLDETIRGQLETYSAEITKKINENLKNGRENIRLIGA